MCHENFNIFLKFFTKIIIFVQTIQFLRETTSKKPLKYKNLLQQFPKKTSQIYLNLPNKHILKKQIKKYIKVQNNLPKVS